MNNYLFSQDFWEFNSKYLAPIIAGYFGTLATFIIIVIAIWGDRLKPKPKLKLYAQNLQGEYAEFANSKPAYFYHLLVKNESSILAKNVKVVCRELFRKSDKMATYQKERLNYPLQFTWAPTEFSQITPNILKDHAVDLGFIEYGKFLLRFYGKPNTLVDYIFPGQSFKLGIEILADNFKEDKLYYFEIVLNETQDRSPENLRKNISIKEMAPLQES